MPQTVRPPKKSTGKIWLTMDFSVKDALIEGDKLEEVLAFQCFDPFGVDVTDDMVEFGSVAITEDNLMLTFLAIGGESGLDYFYDALVETMLGERLPERLVLPVRDK